VLPAFPRPGREALDHVGQVRIATISRLSFDTIAVGAPAGQHQPCQVFASKPGQRGFVDRRQIRARPGRRLRLVTASARSLPSRTCGQRGRHSREHHLHLASEKVGERGRGALVRHVHQLHPAIELNSSPQAAPVCRNPGRREVDPAGAPLAQRPINSLALFTSAREHRTTEGASATATPMLMGGACAGTSGDHTPEACSSACPSDPIHDLAATLAATTPTCSSCIVAEE